MRVNFASVEALVDSHRANERASWVSRRKRWVMCLRRTVRVVMMECKEGGGVEGTVRCVFGSQR